MNTETNQLKERWETLLTEQPQLRIRNAAEVLQVSEAELLATKLNNGVVKLRNEPKAILKVVENLGKVMALTRNDNGVHERKGTYINPEIGASPVGLFVGEDIDLRIFFMHWEYAFAVTEIARGKERHSLQFFGKDGMAIHKIYLTPKSNISAFHELVNTFKAKHQVSKLIIEPFIKTNESIHDNEVDIVNFQKAWLALEDTHQFFGILKKYKVHRTQALRLAPSKHHALPIDKSKIVKLLETVAAAHLPIMVFVGNRGNIQIHTGEIHKTLWHQNWFNVMDPDFNLHLNMDGIAESWIVRKPTADGVVTSIEVFDKTGELIVQFFGKRKPGIPELSSWQDVVRDIEIS
ncbi:hemin-degrading factor [Zhouia sp. PK063]|uniref:hemin-degrading factor n=1 Tax=Zhouia sp. PK063 TaxID=3373602 RepID=UPI00379D1D0F